MKIVLCGSFAVDRIMTFDGRFKEMIQPDKLHVLSLSIILNNLKDTPGGTGANIGYSLALMGEQPVLLCAVGPNTKDYEERLAGLGIDMSRVHHSQKPTASFTVMTDLDNCQVGGFYPGALADSEPLTLSQFKDEETFVVVSSTDPSQMRSNVAECKELGLRLFYDVSQQVSNSPVEDLKAGIETAELLIVNDYELTVLAQRTGQSEQAIKDQVKVCVITLGAEGSEIYRDGTSVSKIKAAKPKAVADPTGAGDAFRAGFLYGYVRGWELPVCAQLGSITAVYAIEKLGTQEHTFTPEELLARYQENYGSFPRKSL